MTLRTRYLLDLPVSTRDHLSFHQSSTSVTGVPRVPHPHSVSGRVGTVETPNRLGPRSKFRDTESELREEWVTG